MMIEAWAGKITVVSDPNERWRVPFFVGDCWLTSNFTPIFS
jgi:hypothetical protein